MTQDCSGNTISGGGSLVASLTLGHPFGTNLDAGLAEALDHGHSRDTPESSNLNNGPVGDDLLGVLSLANTRFTDDQHGLILDILDHATVGTLSNGPQMGWDFITRGFIVGGIQSLQSLVLAKLSLEHCIGVGKRQK